MSTDNEPRIDTANIQIIANSTQKAWLAAEDINAKMFNNEMTTILLEELGEPNEYLLTFAKNETEAKQAQEQWLDEYYEDNY